MRQLLTYPFRLIGSAFYWAQFRVGGALRSRMTSIELDNRQLWEMIFFLQSRVAALENKELDRQQTIAIERVLQRFPEAK